MHPLRRWRRRAAVLVLCFTALGPLLAKGPLPTWTPEYFPATCVGPCCLITQGYVELSCGEYTPPATTPTAGASASNPTGSVP